MQLNITRISDGLGIGEGSISAAALADTAGAETMRRVDTTIASSAILVDVSKDDDGRMVDDDGCGDGRATKVAMRGRQPLRRSLNRAKVFGGGAAMAAADLIGSGQAEGTVLETFRKAINTLADRMVDFGAHTADHVSSEDKCGCGAIDEAPAIIERAARYRDAIQAQCAVLGVPTENVGEVLDNFEQYAKQIAGRPYRGVDVMNLIIDRGKIVKQLGGVHVEARVVLNYVPGKTVDQARVHTVSNGKADIFGVDVWRMQELAEALHPNDALAQLRALQSMLVYTLAVAAVLTKGDLPVYVVKPARQREPALTAA